MLSAQWIGTLIILIYTSSLRGMISPGTYPQTGFQSSQIGKLLSLSPIHSFKEVVNPKNAASFILSYLSLFFYIWKSKIPICFLQVPIACAKCSVGYWRRQKHVRLVSLVVYPSPFKLSDETSALIDILLVSWEILKQSPAWTPDL